MAHVTEDLPEKVAARMMMPIRWWLTAIYFSISCLPAVAGLPETLVLLKPGVVGVGTMQKTRSPSNKFNGTGFVVGDGHYVITNAHVIPDVLAVEELEKLAVFAGQAGRADTRLAEQVAMDLVHDLALLKVDGEALPPLRLGDSDRVREGQEIAFTGFPIGTVLGLFPVTHRGIVSALTPIAQPMQTARQLSPHLIKQLNAPFEVFQLDATAYPGNSGSPMYDPKSGEVLGVLNMVFVKESKESVLEKPSGISYAIPAKYVLLLLENLNVSPLP